MTINIHTIVVSDFDQNARIITDDLSMTAMIIDPGADVETIFEYCRTYSVETIFLTHCHIDHAGGVQNLCNLFTNHQLEVPSVMYHSSEIIIGEYLEQSALQYGFSIQDYKNPPKPSLLADNESIYSIGSHDLTLLFTPGHAPGHVSLYYPSSDFTLSGAYSDTYDCNSVVIAGDTLFAGSIGRTDLPLGNHNQLIESISSKLFTLPNDTLVCPGHGPNTTIGQEKRTNPFFT